MHGYTNKNGSWLIVGRSMKKQETAKLQFLVYLWLRGVDSNYRPLGYEPNELPTAPPRDVLTKLIIQLIYVFCQHILEN